MSKMKKWTMPYKVLEYIKANGTLSVSEYVKLFPDTNTELSGVVSALRNRYNIRYVHWKYENDELVYYLGEPDEEPEAPAKAAEPTLEERKVAALEEIADTIKGMRDSVEWIACCVENIAGSLSSEQKEDDAPIVKVTKIQ